MPRNANQSKQSNYSMFGTTSQKIDASNVPLGSESWTIAVWCKQSNSASNYIFWDMQYGSAGGLKLIQQGGTSGGNTYVYFLAYGPTYFNFQSQQVITEDNWHHVIVRYNKNVDYRIYVDGVLSGLTTNNNTYSWPATRNLELFKTVVDVHLDQFCVFDYALSDTSTTVGDTATGQIATLWGGGTVVSNPMALPSPPIAYYPLGTSAYNGEYLAENNAIGDYVFDFDGSNDYISGTASLPNSDYTISAWINLQTVTTQGVVSWGEDASGKRRALFIWNGGSGDYKLYSSTYNSNIAGSTTLVTGQWYHVAVTVSSAGVAKIYLNGSQDGTGTNTLNAFTSTDFYIGRTPSGEYFNGSISNVQIFNTVLPATGSNSIETLYNYGSPIRTLANIPQSSNLKAWYKLDASEVYNSTSTEWSVDNNQNPSSYPSSLSFNGTNDYIDCGNDSSLSISGDLTISAWIFVTTGSNFQVIVAKRGTSTNYQFFTDNSAIPKLRFYDGAGTVSSIGTLSLNTWHHAVVTVNSGVTNGLTFYIDGVASGTGTATIVSNSNNLTIGSLASGNLFFNGKISNVSIWNTNLSSSQVTEIYNNGTPSNLSSHSATSNLVSWWKLNNTTTGIEDSKGSNNGTNNGATEYPGFVNTLVGDSSGMTQANLVQSDLQTVAPYSKYAIEFDHTDSDYIDLTSDINLGSTFSFSVWLKTDHINNSGEPQNVYVKNITGGTGFFKFNDLFGKGLSNGRLSNYEQGGIDGFALSTNPLNDNIWHHCFVTFDGSTLKSYIDGSLNVTIQGITNWTSNILKKIGRYDTSAIRYFDGILSNMAVWNSDLTATQAREVYNEGLPSDLNTFSGPAPVAWWQLGENSSFDGNNWICADEKGTSNGTSANMTVTNLTNGVGTIANGVSSGMSEGNLVGDAPYSTANAISSGMAVTARGTDVP